MEQQYIITGGTGMVGSALAAQLVAEGKHVIILTRKLPTEKTIGVEYALWNPVLHTMDVSILKKPSIIINLAGAGVADERWSKKRKAEILNSRLQAGTTLVKVLAEEKHQVSAVIQASAIGWYGEDESTMKDQWAGFTEEASSDGGFLGDTCRQWEMSVAPLTALNIRLCTIRIGIVLSNKGGAFPEFRKPATVGLGTILGSGKQWISWIHIQDLVRMIIFLADKIQYSGIFNAVAPHPVTNKEMVTQVAKAWKGSFYIPVYVPSFALQLMMGEMSIEVLKSTKVSAQKIREAGFQFIYPQIKEAVDALRSEHT